MGDFNVRDEYHDLRVKLGFAEVNDKPVLVDVPKLTRVVIALAARIDKLENKENE